MKKLVLAVSLMAAFAAKADIVLDKPSEIETTVRKPVTTITTETNSVAIPAGSKVVWTDFTISYRPPNYTQAVYRITYMIQDPVTKRDIGRSRKVAVLTEAEVVAFAASKGVDFAAQGAGIGFLLNEYLKTLFPEQAP